MKTAYSHSIRLLICGHCGAALAVPTAGATVRCQYCGTSSQLGARNEAAEIAAVRGKQPVNEPDRYQRLLAQDGKPLLPPASLQRFLVGTGLPPQMLPDALREWQQARLEVTHQP